MRSFHLLPLLVFTILGIVTAAAFTPEARRSYEAFEAKVNNGEPEALYKMSRILESGWDSIMPDTVRSIILLRRSADAGYAPAMNYLGFLYGNGMKSATATFLRADRDSMYYWIGKSAGSGDAKGLSNLGFLLLNDTICANRDSIDSRAFGLLEKAASMGVPAAMSMVGDMYRDGRGVTTDTLRAARYYEEALASGLEDAEARLIALMAPKWLTLSPDSAYTLSLKYMVYAPYSAVILLERAAELPDIKVKNSDEIGKIERNDSILLRGQLARAAHAMTLLGDASGRGRGQSYSHKEALLWYARGAMSFNPVAMETIAQTLEFFPDAMSEIVDELEDFSNRLRPLTDLLSIKPVTVSDLSDPEELHCRVRELRER